MNFPVTCHSISARVNIFTANIFALCQCNNTVFILFYRRISCFLRCYFRCRCGCFFCNFFCSLWWLGSLCFFHAWNNAPIKFFSILCRIRIFQGLIYRYRYIYNFVFSIRRTVHCSQRNIFICTVIRFRVVIRIRINKLIVWIRYFYIIIIQSTVFVRWRCF